MDVVNRVGRMVPGSFFHFLNPIQILSLRLFSDFVGPFFRPIKNRSGPDCKGPWLSLGCPKLGNWWRWCLVLFPGHSGSCSLLSYPETRRICLKARVYYLKPNNFLSFSLNINTHSEITNQLNGPHHKTLGH